MRDHLRGAGYVLLHLAAAVLGWWLGISAAAWLLGVG